MRVVLSCLLLFVMCSATGQGVEELEKHRYEYKSDLYTNIKADTSKVDFFPFNEKLIITGRVEMLKDQPVFKLTTSSGKTKEAQKFVKVSFRYKGREQSFYGYQLVQLKNSEKHADHFFIPFKDGTTGKKSYEAGRYLDFETGDIKDGKLVIDFNKAYNPYCAFTDGYNCPIPPRENHLKIKVKAGEKKYKGELGSL